MEAKRIKTQNDSYKKSRDESLDFLYQSSFLNEVRTPNSLKAIILSIGFFFIIFCVFSTFLKISETVKVSGEIVPSSNIKVIQHIDGGIIKKIHIFEGVQVQKGDVLVELEDKIRKEELNRANLNLVSLNLSLERIYSLLENRPHNLENFSQNAKLNEIEKSLFTSMKDAHEKEKNVLKSQLEKKILRFQFLLNKVSFVKRGFKILKEKYHNSKLFFSKGLINAKEFLTNKSEYNASFSEYMELIDEVSESYSAIKEDQKKIESFEQEFTNKLSKEMSQLEKEKIEIISLIKQLQEKISGLQILAPIDGIIHNLNFSTIGGVIKGGEEIATIYPLKDTLLAEVKVSPNDVGHLKNGMHVSIKITSYDFSRYGSVKGKLVNVSPTTFTQQDGNTYYKGLIELDKNYVGNKTNLILSGMLIQGDIISGEKTLLQYLIKPIHVGLNSSFGER